jgi:phosphatidylserine/phosphatidylglycerophosphate/cardiolipin synthase-like enzyme
MAEAPTTDLALTLTAIESAKQTLSVNIYELTSPQIVDALIQKISAGLQVQILLEGQPVGGLSAAAKGIESQIASAMHGASSADHLFVMEGKKRRFHYDHAKYVVIDHQAVLIGSENYSPTGNPEEGTLGNRGWEVLIHDADLAGQFERMFSQDAVTSFGDIQEVHAMNPNVVTPTSPLLGTADLPTATASQAVMIASPDSSLPGMEDAIRSATQSIDIEQMTFDSEWTGGNSNPLLTDLLDAAKRGVQIRVLLNDESVFDHPDHPSKSKNIPTLNTLNQNGGGKITARIANIKRMGVDYIHNKGMLIDGQITMISSVNWDENSFQHNRETAVLITSADVNKHYESLFDSDWNASQTSSPSFTSDLATEAHPNLVCPDSLEVRVEIDNLNLTPEQKEAFGSLSGKKISGAFNKMASGRSCSYEASNARGGSAARQYLEIRAESSGGYMISFEGYTSQNKIFSVRSKLASGVKLFGIWEASVYDGSGPARAWLGNAVIGLE